MRKLITLLGATLLAGSIQTAAAATVFYSDFDTTLNSAIAPGGASLTGVQGYAGLGPVGNQFSGSFLRSDLSVGGGAAALSSGKVEPFSADPMRSC